MNTLGPDADIDPSVRDFAADRVWDHTGIRIRAADVHLLGRRHGYWVLRCTVSGTHPDLTIKLAGPEAELPVDFERTAAVVARASDAGVPVARPLGADSSYEKGAWRYLLQELVAGHEWRDFSRGLPAHDVAAGHREIARVLLLMQSLRFESFGAFDSNGCPTPSQDLLTALRRRASETIRGSETRAVFLDVLQRSSRLFSGHDQPTLCHDDLHHRNLLFEASVTGPRVTAVLDWDKAWSGPAESDVARLAMWDDMTGPGFWSVYRAEHPPGDGEDVRRLIYQLLWCFEYDAKTARHREDTRRVCHLLGLLC